TDTGPADLPAEQCARLTAAAHALETVNRRERPYHEFRVTTGAHRGDILLTYEGSSSPGERVRLSVCNPGTGRWDPLGTGTTAFRQSVLVDAGVYARDGVLTARAEQVLIGNGSNTFLWSTDMQYYTYFQDLSPMYGEVMAYAADSYRNGGIAY